MKNYIRLTLDDIIFEGRNKLYGAYALRREYPRHLAIAVSVIVAFLLLSLPLPNYLHRNTTFDDIAVPAKPKEKVIEIIIPNIEEIKRDKLPADPVLPSVNNKTVNKSTNTTQVINLVDEETTQTSATEIVTGGNVGSTTDTGITEVTSTISGGTETGTIEVFKEPMIENFAEVLPTFPGGDAALAKQINKLLKYPRDAVAAGIEGVVYVSFVVDPNGDVSRIKVEKGIGGGCDQEAVRVIGMLSGWSPAIQNGNPVFFKYVMPVRFVIRK